MSNKRKNRFILVGIILLLVASLSVGFSAFEKQLLIDDINLDVRLERDVRVTGVTAISSFEATPTIEEYNEKKVLPTITFSKANGYAKFKVDITNFGNVLSGLYNITSNTSGITVQLCDSNGNNCTSDFRTKINGTLGTSKEIGLYIKSTTAGTKNIDLDFDFEPYHTITYDNFDESTSGFITEIMEKDSYEYTFTGDIEEIEVTGAATYTYNKNTKSLNISNVTSDITITAEYLLNDFAETQYTGSNPDNYVLFNNTLFRIVTKETIDDGYGNEELRTKIVSNTSVGNHKFDSDLSDYDLSDLSNYLNSTYYNALDNTSKDLIETAQWTETAIKRIGLIDKTNAENNLSWWNGDQFTLTPDNIPTSKLYKDNNIRFVKSNKDYLIRKMAGSPDPTSGNPIFAIIDRHVTTYSSANSLPTHPCIYLKTDVLIVGGNGTQVNPYRIALPGDSLQANPTRIVEKTLTVTGSNQQLVTEINKVGTVYYSVGTQLNSSNYTSGSTTIPSRAAVGSYNVYYYIPAWQNYKAKAGKVTSRINGIKYTATYIKGNYVDSISKESDSCTTTGTSLSCNVTLPSFQASTGYAEAGWSTNQNATSGTPVGASVTLSENTTYYTVVEHELTATFVANGANSIGSTTESCTYSLNNYGCTITTPSITRNGYTIIGWSTDPEDTMSTVGVEESIYLEENKTYYAISSTELSATFNLNGNQSFGEGSGSEYEASCTIYNTQTSCTTTAPNFVPSSQNALGYSTSPDDHTNIVLYSGDTLTLTTSSNYEYYAQSYSPATMYELPISLEGNGAEAEWDSTAWIFTDMEAYNGAMPQHDVSLYLPGIISSGTVVGWGLTADATTAVAGPNTFINNYSGPLTTVSTLYAITYKDFDIIFDKNTAYSQTPKNGSATTAQTVTETCRVWNADNTCIITSPTITAPQYYEPVGYSTSPEGTTSDWNVNTAQNILSMDPETFSNIYYAITREKDHELLNLSSINISNTTYNSITATLTVGGTLETPDPDTQYYSNNYQYLVTTSSSCPTTGYTTSTTINYNLTINDITSSSTFRICARTVSTDGTITGNIVSTTFTPQYAMLNLGKNVNLNIKRLVNEDPAFSYGHNDTLITNIQKATSLPEGFTPSTYNTISIGTSPIPVYVYWDSTNTTLYYYTTANYILLNPDSSNLFRYFGSLTNIDLSAFDTSKVTDMSYMFSSCSSLTTLDLSSFNTSNVTDMSVMFSNCPSLTTLDLSSFNTSNVTDMSVMFYRSDGLTTLDLSSFNTSNVTDMHSMFTYCSGLTTLDLSSFNVSNVTTMVSMFEKCNALTTLDLSSFTASNVTTTALMFSECSSLTTIIFNTFSSSNLINMNKMFYKCSSLTTLDLSSFNTSNVTDMSYLFYTCSNLTTLNISSFNTGNVTTMSCMFLGCGSLTTLDLSSFNTSNVTTMASMFSGCSGLTTLNLSSFNTSNVTTMASMFSGCSGLTTLNLSSFNTSNVTNMNKMFYGCSGLTTLDLSTFNTGNVINMSSMFEECTGLTTLNISSFNTGNVTTMSSMFRQCSSLTTLDLSSFNTSNVATMHSMFERCSSLTTVNLSSFNTSNVTDMAYMFNNCSNLVILNLSSFNTSNVTEMYFMFAYASKLTTIFASLLWSNASVTSGSNTFSGCTKLVGGNGTAYSDSVIGANSTSAVIDTPSTPGYLTLAGALLDTGSTVNSKIKTLVGSGDTDNTIESITRNLSLPPEFRITDGNTISSADSPYPVYIYFESADSTLYYYTDSKNIYMNADSSNLFKGFSKVESIDLSFVYSQMVTSMANMFDGDISLTSLNLSAFITKQVTNMSSMFAGCESLASLDVSMFNTVKVINMNSMFSGCRRLTTIDLTYFNTNAVKDMAYMFKDCPGVATIFIGNNWKTTSVTSSTQMFYNCTSLVGENGTAYNASNVDKTYARRDLSGSPGYLTLGNTLMKGTSGASNTAYLNTPIIKNTIEKITFMNTTTPNINLTVLGIYDVSINQNNSVQLWYTDSDSDDLYEVYIGQEGGVVASSGEYLFSGLGQLTSIEGLLNFDTSNVYNMAYMFQYCARLTSLSLSTFNTSNVKTMAYMFRGCTNLNNINLYGFNTSKVTNFQYMFDGDTSLTELNLTSFTMGTIRINTNYMFNNCTRLTTIYAGSSWDTIMVNTSTNMFYNCLALVGENGTVYNSSNVDITYAVIDSASTPGYFSQYITVTMDALYCGSDTQVMVTNVDKPNLIQSSYAYAYGGTVGSSPCSSASYNITNNAHQYNFSNSKPNVVCLRLTDILGNYYYFPTTPRSNGADCWW